MKEIVLAQENLPETVEELNETILVGKEYLKARKAEIRAIERIGMAKSTKDAVLSETQDIAEDLLDAEVRLGDLLQSMPDFHSSGRGTMKRKHLPNNITKKESHHAQTLANNRDFLELRKAKARQDGRVLTSHEVYKEIKVMEKEKAKEDRKLEVIKKAEQFQPNNLIEVHHGDFKEVSKDIADNSVDLILTDPPYPKEDLPSWSGLSEVAVRVLKPGGFCIAYSGQLYLPEVMNRLSEHLEYYWHCALLHEGQSQLVHARNVLCEFKPVLVFYKKPFAKMSRPFSDVANSPQREKSLHKWQQSEEGFRHFLEYFSEPGDLILEPFSGSGTVPKVCQELKRRCIAIDKEKECVEITKGRLATAA